MQGLKKLVQFVILATKVTVPGSGVMNINVDDKKRSLKIAILLDKFLPSRGGERYFTFLAEELAKKGHEVHIFATEVEEIAGRSYRVHLVPVWSFPRGLRILTFLHNSDRLIRSGSFDVVHGVAPSLAVNVYNPHGGVEEAYLRQEFASMPSKLYYSYRFLRRRLGFRHYLDIWAQRRLYRLGGVVRTIAISQMIKNDLMTYYQIPESKIAVVFNAVDLDRFRPENRETLREQKRTALGLTSSTVTLLFVGNNYRLKGLETLIRALALLSKAQGNSLLHLLVVGRGRARRYRNIAGRLGVSHMVSFLGAVTGMEEYYAASDIYVHPTFYDSCSLTVLEALASGLPTITTRFNGAADAIISDEGGLVISDPGDPSELADAITFFMDEGRRVRARTVARSWMEQYPLKRNLEETLAVYYAAVNGE